MKTFTTSDITNLGRLANNKIFIAESLTAKNKQLFAKCLEFKKQNNMKQIWTSNGKIFLSKDEHSPPWHVKSPKDLELHADYSTPTDGAGQFNTFASNRE